MNKILFIIFGSIGLMIWIIIGHLLAKNRNTTPQRFAGIMSTIFSVLMAILILISNPPGEYFGIFIFIFLAITFITGFAVLYVAYPKITKYIHK
jgi:hypothetical protein